MREITIADMIRYRKKFKCEELAAARQRKMEAEIAIIQLKRDIKQLTREEKYGTSENKISA